MASAYIRFANEKRPTLADRNLSFAETGRELGRMWRALSAEEKAQYEDGRRRTSTTTSSRTTSSTRRAPPPKPKKLTAFEQFRLEEIPRLKELHSGATETELDGLIDELWNELPEDEQGQYGDTSAPVGEWDGSAKVLALIPMSLDKLRDYF